MGYIIRTIRRLGGGRMLMSDVAELQSREEALKSFGVATEDLLDYAKRRDPDAKVTEQGIDNAKILCPATGEEIYLALVKGSLGD